MRYYTSATLQGRYSIRIAVSTVTGRFILKPDPTTTNYIFILVGSGFSSLQECRGSDLGSMVNYYNLLLYNVAATSAALLFLSCYYKLLVVSLLMPQDSREDASLR